MLNQITISNYAVVDQLDLDISSGMTAITGETGAGKSIMLDALSLALGGRADYDSIRAGAKRADIQACFDLKGIPAAQQWLKEKDYDAENINECILRRVITKDGRSKGYINGTPSTLTELKSIGAHLIDIHSQHAHQSLLNKRNHSILLDNFAKTTNLAQKVAETALEHHRTAEVLNAMVSKQQERDERIQLLSYQLQELEQINLQPGEVASLEKEQQHQAQAESILSACNQVTQTCISDDGECLLQQISNCLHKLTNLQADNATINNCVEMLSSARIQVEEAAGELSNFIDYFEADPEKAQLIEDRLSAIYELARKHRVQPEELLAKQQQISDTLEKTQHHDEQVVELEATIKRLMTEYNQVADQLSKKRRHATNKLEKQVTARITLLGMPKGQFQIQLTDINPHAISPLGLETIEFLVTANPGQPIRPLGKVASGGELSRISLAIQVIIAQSTNTPTLVFDEVDVGIGGGTAEVVGNMLKEIGSTGQVLCVTHQPQVASQAHQHLYVSKKSSNSTSSTNIHSLEGDHRVTEIARMLGGLEITSPTMNHAQEMLLQAQS